MRESGGGDRHPIYVDEPDPCPPPTGAKRWGSAMFKLGAAIRRKGSMRGGLTAPEHCPPGEQSAPNAGVGASQTAALVAHASDALQSNNMSTASVVTAPSVESPPHEQGGDDFGKRLTDRLSRLSHGMSAALGVQSSTDAGEASADRPSREGSLDA